MTAGKRPARRGRGARVGFAALVLAVSLTCGLVATWPSWTDGDDGYLARPAPGYGEAAAGDHLQLGWALWLPGHQLARGAAPWSDPYSFRPEAEAAPNVQGWLLGAPYWPLDRALGPVWAWNVIVLLSFAAAGALTTWWLRAVGLTRAGALTGGAVFTLAPYLAGQRTGHLLGLIAFLLPATLLALERRRTVLAGLALAAIPLSGQLHLALGAIPLVLGYAWARTSRAEWWKTGAAAAAAVAAGIAVQQAVVAGSIGGGRSFAQVERYSAEATDFVRRGVGSGVEELVFLGWLTPVLALVGLVALTRRRERGLAWCLWLAAVVPCLLALGANLPGYELLWRAFPPLGATRVPERLMPVAWIAIAALAAVAADLVAQSHKARWLPAAVAGVAVVALAVDLRIPLFASVEPDRPNAGYAALRGDGRLLELPVFRPDLHYGSAYLGYSRQSPHERPQGYSTTAPPAADRIARVLRGVSCGRIGVPPGLGIRFVAVHRGLYAQSGFFGARCADDAEARLRADGWRLLARDGAIAVYGR